MLFQSTDGDAASTLAALLGQLPIQAPAAQIPSQMPVQEPTVPMPAEGTPVPSQMPMLTLPANLPSEMPSAPAASQMPSVQEPSQMPMLSLPAPSQMPMLSLPASLPSEMPSAPAPSQMPMLSLPVPSQMPSAPAAIQMPSPQPASIPSAMPAPAPMALSADGQFCFEFVQKVKEAQASAADQVDAKLTTIANTVYNDRIATASTQIALALRAKLASTSISRNAQNRVLRLVKASQKSMTQLPASFATSLHGLNFVRSMETDQMIAGVCAQQLAIISAVTSKVIANIETLSNDLNKVKLNQPSINSIISSILE